MKIKLSIIIPVYNVQDYLRDCINSILDQNSINTQLIEIILIDDGSTDDSGKICDEFDQKMDCIRAIHIDNSGQSVARNVGLKYSTGEWVTYVDSDDITRKGYLKLILDIIQNISSTEIVMFNFKFFESNSELREWNSTLEYDSSKLNLISKAEAMYDITTEKWGNYLCNKIFPRKILNKYPLPAGKVYEDISTTYKYFYGCNQIMIYKDNVYFYRQRQGSTTHLKKEYDQYISMIQAVEARKKQLEFFEKHHYVKAYNNAKYGLMLNSVSLILLTLKNKYKKDETYFYARSFLKKYKCNLKRDGIKHCLFIKMYKFI